MIRATLSEWFSGLRERPVLPVHPRHDDLYLVEFPKSGVTWLCYLIANTNLLLAGEARRATFFNLTELVPDIHANRQLAPPNPLPGFRCIKSHAVFVSRYKRVVYLVRDPRNVMPSYFHYLSGLGQWQGSFEEFVRHPKLGIAAWRRHVEGWLDGVEGSTAFVLLRYEDLVADVAEQLRRIYRHLGFTLEENLVTEVVARSCAERMRTDEAFFNAGHPRLQGFDFVRKEAMGGARQAVPDTIRLYIESQAAPLMHRLGYKV